MLVKKPEPPPHKIELFLFQWRNWLHEIYKYITRQQPYGGFYQYELGTIISVSASGTYYLITGNSAGVLNDVSFASNALTVTYSGKYLVTTTTSVSDGGNTEYETAVFVDGVKNQLSACHAGTTGSLHSNMAGTAIISLNAGSVVDIRIVNHTNTNDPVIRHCSVSLVWLS